MIAWKERLLLLLSTSLIVPALVHAQGSEKVIEASIEDFLQNLSTVPKVLDRRDPFEESKPSFIKEEKLDNGIGEAMAITANDELPPLERYPAEQYRVKAVLLGDKYPRALVLAPNGGTAIVKESARLGDKNGVIERIDRTGIQVLEKIKNTFGSYDNVTVNLPVGGLTK